MTGAKLCDLQIRRKKCRSTVLSCEPDGKIQKVATFPHCLTLLQPYQTSSSAIGSCIPPSIFLCSFLHLGCSSSWDVPGDLQLTHEDHVRIHFFKDRTSLLVFPGQIFLILCDISLLGAVHLFSMEQASPLCTCLHPLLHWKSIPIISTQPFERFLRCGRH